jgi:penicillin-binding protein 2
VISLFVLRLWYLQILNGDELRAFSEQNSIKETRIAAPRGLITDRNGQILVENLPGFEAQVSPQFVDDLDETTLALSKALDIPAQQIVQTIQRSRRVNGPFRPVRIKENLSRDDILNLELIRTDFPGIDIKESVLRSYPLKSNGAQLLGYVGEISKRQLPILNERHAGKVRFQQGDIIGRSGIEERLDLYLRGRDGISVSQVDARGREAVNDGPSLLGSLQTFQPAELGNNVELTIDRDIQEATWNAMVSNQRIGAAVAMKVNGEVLAWVSTPSFDPNEFSTGISPQVWSKLINDPDKPLRNKVIQDHNSPGSTFKPLIAIAALAEGVVTPWTYINCPGSLRFGNRSYHDHLRGGHGNLRVDQAIERSSNVFFYRMGIALGIDRMFRYCAALGIGQPTGIDVGAEAMGLMPSSEWKRETMGEDWQPGENLSNAIGQGFVLATPLQMAVAYNAIGTGGKVVRPFVIQRVSQDDGQVIYQATPQVVRDLGDQKSDFYIKKDVFSVVQNGLHDVVNGERGTARASRLPFVEFSGKTGTSQVMSFSADQIFARCDAKPRHMRHHGWFVGFAPSKNPEIAFAVLAEHACSGSGGAAPIAKEIVRAYVAKYRPEWLSRNVHKKPAAPAPAPDPESEGE